MFFTSLEQRMAHGYLEMLPPFIPDNDASVSVSEQERFYDLIRSLHQLSFDEPLLFVGALHEDDAYPSRYKKPYGKPNLIADMRKYTKAVDSLLLNMFLIGQGKEAAFNRRQQAVLSRLGIVDYTNLPDAWVWMAAREGASLQSFSHCAFNAGYPYTSDIYSRLLGETPFRRLESWMLDRGYKRFDLHNVTASDCKLSLTIANPKWNNSAPSGGFEYKIKHTGVAAQFDDYANIPAVFGLCIPNSLKPYLTAFDAMEEKLQNFVIRTTKKCDGCRYCVQTDKSGTRPLACIPIMFENHEYHLCPYFPGYCYSWNSIDESLTDELIRMLSFMDRFVPNK